LRAHFILINIFKFILDGLMIAPKFTLAATGETLCTKRCSCYNEDRFLSLVKILRDADVAYTNLETKIHSFKGYPMPVETMGPTQ